MTTPPSEAPTPLTIRPAVDADLDALVELIESAYRGDKARGGWTHEADLLGGQRIDADMLRDMLSDPKTAIVVAFEEDALVACVEVRDKNSAAYLGLLTVRPDRQAAGLGRQLIAAAEAHGREVFGRDLMQMTVIRQRTELVAYYERRGYRLTGETAPFPYGDDRFGKPTRDDLEFAVMEKPIGEKPLG